MSTNKDFYPYIKDPSTGVVYPNTGLFRKSNFIGCFTADGIEDISRVSQIELNRIFPEGVPERIKTMNAAEIARRNDAPADLAPGIEMEKSVVIKNLERLFADGVITREYLLGLAGGVESEKFVAMQDKVSTVLENVNKEEAKTKAAKEAEAEAKAKAEAEAKAALESEAEAAAAKAALEFDLEAGAGKDKKTTKSK